MLILLVVFAAAKLLAELVEWLGMPGLVGEIVAGILVGPSVLNLVQRGELPHLAADLGVLFLLFQVGLEVKPQQIFQVGATATAVAVAGVIVPFFAGWGILLLCGEPHIEAVFTGAAMVETSVGITARVLSAKGLLGHVSSQTILAAAVIDDVLGLLVLAVVSSMARGSVDIAQLATTAGLAVGFTIVMATLGTRTVGRVLPKVEGKLRAGEIQFNLSVILLFALAVLAVRLGVAAIIGAFLAGMALSQTVNRRVHDLAQGVTELFVPFFLASIGIQLELSALASPSMMLLAAVILAAAILTKLVGCGLGALPLGRANMLRVGLGMVPRGEVGMVVAQLGASMGVISAGVYGVVVSMAIFTTIVAPPFLKLAYQGVPMGEPREEFTVG